MLSGPHDLSARAASLFLVCQLLGLDSGMRGLSFKCGAKLIITRKKKEKENMDTISTETAKQVHFNSFNN